MKETTTDKLDAFASLSSLAFMCISYSLKRYQRLFGFTVPLFWGRTIWGIVPSVMPKRTPIHIVVGPPLRAPKIKVRFLLLPLSLPFSLLSSSLHLLLF